LRVFVPGGVYIDESAKDSGMKAPKSEHKIVVQNGTIRTKQTIKRKRSKTNRQTGGVYYGK